MTPPVDRLISPSTTSHTIHNTEHNITAGVLRVAPPNSPENAPSEEENSGVHDSLERGRDPETEAEAKQEHDIYNNMMCGCCMLERTTPH